MNERRFGSACARKRSAAMRSPPGGAARGVEGRADHARAAMATPATPFASSLKPACAISASMRHCSCSPGTRNPFIRRGWGYAGYAAPSRSTRSCSWMMARRSCCARNRVGWRRSSARFATSMSSSHAATALRATASPRRGERTVEHVRSRARLVTHAAAHDRSDGVAGNRRVANGARPIRRASTKIYCPSPRDLLDVRRGQAQAPRQGARRP